MMAKLRRILLKSIVHVIRQCKSKDQLCEAKIGDKWYWITYFHLAILEEGEAAAKVEEEAKAQDACREAPRGRLHYRFVWSGILSID